MKPEEILELYDELGRPSTAKFARALRKRGMKITDEDVQKNIVGLQGERQLRAPPPRYQGHIFSLGIDEKWVADIMVIPPGRHALIVQDVFSRLLWARKMDSQADVVAPMLQNMRVRQPRVLYTDADVAFRSKAFRTAMEDIGVDFRVKLGRNDIATVDRAIGILGETIVRYTTSSGEGDWMKHLDRAVSAFNRNDLEYLANEAPEDVEKGSQLEEFLRRKNMHFLEHNLRLRAGRTALRTFGLFARIYRLRERASDAWVIRAGVPKRIRSQVSKAALWWTSAVDSTPSMKYYPWLPRARGLCCWGEAWTSIDRDAKKPSKRNASNSKPRWTQQAARKP